MPTNTRIQQKIADTNLLPLDLITETTSPLITTKTYPPYEIHCEATPTSECFVIQPFAAEPLIWERFSDATHYPAPSPPSPPP
jgi:hypothetical protein